MTDPEDGEDGDMQAFLVNVERDAAIVVPDATYADTLTGVTGPGWR